MMDTPQRIIDAPKKRVWFYKPEWYWGGWRRLFPVWTSHDEYSRETLVLGWDITGQVIIATRYCGDADCYADTIKYLDYLEEDQAA